MSIKLNHHRGFVSMSSSRFTQLNAQKSIEAPSMCSMIAMDNMIFVWPKTRKKSFIRCTEFKNCHYSHSGRVMRLLKQPLVSHKYKRVANLPRHASADDDVIVNGNLPVSTSSSVEAMRIRLDQSLQTENYNDGLVQSLYDAARVFELSFKEQSSLSKMAWFLAAWIGVDHNAWIKTLSYQASVYSLLQAVNEFSSYGGGQDGDINITLQTSLLRLSAPLESVIREKISAKQPELLEWFWSEQIPIVIRTFVDHFERDPRFRVPATSRKRYTPSLGSHSNASNLIHFLTCIASVSKLGPAKVSCTHFYSMIPDITGKLMDMLVDAMPMREAYQSVKDIGLCKEFLVHFGPRVASSGLSDDSRTNEVVFWVDLVQKQLQQAIDREKIWTRLTTSESIEILERDLAIFGFFIALGRSTKFFLIANGFENLDGPLDHFLRYLIGGCVLCYPQLSSISSYQLYVEVVCEELDWLVFYPGYANTMKYSHEHKSKSGGPPNADAISRSLEVCSYWIESFIKHSQWLENPSHVKAAQFLSKGHDKLREAVDKLGVLKSKSIKDNASYSLGRTGSKVELLSDEDPGSFDKALESVEGALVRLESLLEELHVSSLSSEREHLKAACSDLERIRKLKKEAEFFEASFRAKTASLQQTSTEQRNPKGKSRGGGTVGQDKKSSLGKFRGLWSFLVPRPEKKSKLENAENVENGAIQCNDTFSSEEFDKNAFQRFEQLRSELVELEKRFQQSANQPENEQESEDYGDKVEASGLAKVQKNDNIIEKSFKKLKDTSTNVWQGTQLLAIDVAAAMGLLQRAIIGDELTEKEKQILKRTLTDLASVVPIGVLMLLPVTAVGHAAMLAAIQRYVPALIPSTYGSERLDLLRQLEKVKEMKSTDPEADENLLNDGRS